MIPYNKPTFQHTSLDYIAQALQSNHRHGSGQFTARAVEVLKNITGAHKILLTHSCTGALELAMILMDVGVGDEVILPSFTFSSTANAVVLRGATPVFCDVDPDTLCMNVDTVAKLITDKTRALLPVHYAGMSCDMPALCELAKEHGLIVLEDAAQTLGSSLNGQALGTFGCLGALSFHDSKNISCGEGGALLINNELLEKRAEILWEKGTNRSQFLRGEVDKYTWCDVGSSFLPSEVTAAFLLAQLEVAEEINNARVSVWDKYYLAFAENEAAGQCKRPTIPAGCQHNGHIFYLILNDHHARNELLQYLKANQIGATFHYVPLHDSPAGLRFGKAPLPLPNTYAAGHCLIRLPLYPEMTVDEQDKVIAVTKDFLSQCSQKIGASLI